MKTNTELKEINRTLRQVSAKSMPMPPGGEYDHNTYTVVEIHDRTLIALSVKELDEIVERIESSPRPVDWEDVATWWPFRWVDAFWFLENKIGGASSAAAVKDVVSEEDTIS